MSAFPSASARRSHLRPTLTPPPNLRIVPDNAHLDGHCEGGVSLSRKTGRKPCTWRGDLRFADPCALRRARDLRAATRLDPNGQRQGQRRQGGRPTDDTASIQAAIDEVMGTKGTVLLPKGIYMIDAVKRRLKLGSDMTLELAEGAVLKAIPNDAEILPSHHQQRLQCLGDRRHV